MEVAGRRKFLTVLQSPRSCIRLPLRLPTQGGAAGQEDTGRKNKLVVLWELSETDIITHSDKKSGCLPKATVFLCVAEPRSNITLIF